MESPALVKPPEANQLKSYPVLRRLVEETLLVGQRKIEALKVQTYWQTGAYINEHVRLNGARAEYGKQVLLKLSRDVKVDVSVLRRLAQFAAKFPENQIRATWRESPSKPGQIAKTSAGKPLFWSHFRLLITVEDDRARLRLTEKAGRASWPVERLADEVWKLKMHRKELSSSGNDKEKKLLTPRLGQLYTWRLVAPSKIRWPASGGLMLDRGFKGYTWLRPEGVRGFGADEIVEIKDGRIVRSERTARDLFIYLAYVDYVIDADTLWVALDTGLATVSRQKLRLRAIDSPEINTARGRRAYEFLKATLAESPFLIVRSYKNDKYDRYETDLFIPKPDRREADPAALVLEDLIFINNLLLETGHAVRIEE